MVLALWISSRHLPLSFQRPPPAPPLLTSKAILRFLRINSRVSSRSNLYYFFKPPCGVASRLYSLRHLTKFSSYPDLFELGSDYSTKTAPLLTALSVTVYPYLVPLTEIAWVARVHRFRAVSFAHLWIFVGVRQCIVVLAHTSALELFIVEGYGYNKVSFLGQNPAVRSTELTFSSQEMFLEPFETTSETTFRAGADSTGSKEVHRRPWPRAISPRTRYQIYIFLFHWQRSRPDQD